MTLQEIPFEFSSDRDVTIRGKLITPTTYEGDSYPVVVMLSGDGTKGTKSDTWVNVPKMLVSRGIASFLFDFQGLGYSDGERRKLTLSVGLSNLRDAMGQLRTFEQVDQQRIGLFGSSFGGNIAILYAGDAPELKCVGVKSPVSFYPDSFYSEYGDGDLSRWAQNGYLDNIGFEYSFYLDAFRHNTYGAAMKIRCPCLITHGTSDNVVPLIQSKHLLAALRNASTRRLEIFEGIGHGYSEPGAWERMAALFVNWFAHTL